MPPLYPLLSLFSLARPPLPSLPRLARYTSISICNCVHFEPPHSHGLFIRRAHRFVILFLFSPLIHLRLTITWRPFAHSNYMSLLLQSNRPGETMFCIQRRWRRLPPLPSRAPTLSLSISLSPPSPLKSFIAYPTLPTTCYTIPEDTQRGNLCPGIAAACEIRSRLRKSPRTRNAQCDAAYTRFRLAESLLPMDTQWGGAALLPIPAPGPYISNHPAWASRAIE